jgi:UDP-N-acetylglucosamine 2-epimerase (non-hydrolysing)
MIKVLTLFGTRPEIIKLAPVIRALEQPGSGFQTVNVTSAQHTDLLYPFVRLFGVGIHHDLQVMAPDQTPNQVCAKVLAALDPLLDRERPEVIVVQGDTTTALAGALAGFHRSIPVGHVEAGLRSGNRQSPFPEEMNRRLISQLATYHFAATAGNRDALVADGIAEKRIFITGNPVVDSLQATLERLTPGPEVAALLRRTEGLKRIVLTTHRRESFGETLAANLRVLGDFVARHDDVALLFPVHPNPAVRGPTQNILANRPRVELLEPQDYFDFIGLLANAWLIVSDSGGIQEEAPTLGKPLLVLRENTERPEAVTAGIAQLVGDSPEHLRHALETAYARNGHLPTGGVENPFGRGDSGRRIVEALRAVLA